MSKDKQNGQRRHGRSKVTHRAAAAAQSLKSLERWSNRPLANHHSTAEAGSLSRSTGGDDSYDLLTQMADANVPPPPTA